MAAKGSKVSHDLAGQVALLTYRPLGPSLYPVPSDPLLSPCLPLPRLWQVLTTEDLSNALKNYGVTVMKTDVLGPAAPPQPPASAARGDQAAASGGNAAGGVAAAESGA
jgi:hypothetical protein